MSDRFRVDGRAWAILICPEYSYEGWSDRGSALGEEIFVYTPAWEGVERGAKTQGQLLILHLPHGRPCVLQRDRLPASGKRIDATPLSSRNFHKDPGERIFSNAPLIMRSPNCIANCRATRQHLHPATPQPCFRYPRMDLRDGSSSSYVSIRIFTVRESHEGLTRFSRILTD